MTDQRDEGALPPRYAPEIALPPYSYVPGRFPHPISDPRGHSFGAGPPTPDPRDPARWGDCRVYLHGIDLFNHGYYWEAHEAWEGLWLACGRSGPTATFLKGLIKLAAAGVKVREGKPNGVVRHARRGAELFREAGQQLDDDLHMGLRLSDLIAWAEQIADDPPACSTDVTAQIEVVFTRGLVCRR